LTKRQEVLTLATVEEGIVTVTSSEQFKALGHPMRHRLLFALGRSEATISQLAATLGSNKGNVAHHLKVLADAGLVELAGTRHVRGGTEQYYRRAFERLQVENAGGPTEAAFSAVAAEIATAESEPFLTLRMIRLTPEHAERLTATLRQLADEAEDGGDQPRHGLLLGLYKPAQAHPSSA
jgi:DNA-binding transcriptional ArsR family regulator